ncbi:MAG: hypothetical protein DRP09_16330 [Candidatus Thorarchaeota archaeon]|nr:MAG: hypothetical protein DRP09_16330 [Candidatus Thorarchaeota archaeon]
MADRIPNITVQEVASGNKFTGVAPNGTDSDQTIENGRLRKYSGGSLGGLYVSPANCGVRLNRILWNLPGGGTIKFSLFDSDGIEYPLHETSDTEGQWEAGTSDIMLPPNWELKVTNSVNLTGDGRIVLMVGLGWEFLFMQTVTTTP